MPIGDKLQDLLNLRKTNPNKLSLATGVNVGTIYSIIRRNNTKVNLEDLQTICDELGVNLDYFTEKESLVQQRKTPSTEVEGMSRADLEDGIVTELMKLSPERRKAVLDFATFQFQQQRNEESVEK